MAGQKHENKLFMHLVELEFGLALALHYGKS